MKSLLLDHLSDRVLIYDGAMGTQIQGADLTRQHFAISSAAEKHLSPTSLQAVESLGEISFEGCNELLSITQPQLIQDIHSRYFAAGSDLVETNTFGCTTIVLADYGLQALVYDLCLASAKVARAAADAHSTPNRPKFVVGALGPGTKLITLGQATWDELVTTYQDGFTGLLDGGADALLLETLQDLLMVKAGIIAARNAMQATGREVPLFVQITLEQTGTMLVGSELAAAMNMVEAFPEVCAFGMNCATGPVEMAPHVRFLGANSSRPIAIQPNAGLPLMEGGRAVYKLTPDELAEHHTRFVEEFGVALVGGCCGTTPAHIQKVAEALAGTAHRTNAHWHKVRHLFPGFDFRLTNRDQAEGIALKGCSSLFQFVPFRQDNSFLIVGEKTNANGSRAFRDMLAAENWEGLTELAGELEAEGSHVLDVCTAFVGRDEVRDMHELLSRYNKRITAPIMIDSTESPVIERSLQTLAGKPIVNSINFEDGGARAHRVLKLCREYGAAVVGLTIDEEGMAKTAEKKVAIAERIIALAREYGILEHDIFLDCLTFTLGSGDEEFRASAIETLNAIKEVTTRYPLVNTVLGVSNVSFGLKPAIRQIINSAFLNFAREVGLSAAIVHFSKIVPESDIPADVWTLATDLIYDRRKYAALAG